MQASLETKRQVGAVSPGFTVSDRIVARRAVPGQGGLASDGSAVLQETPFGGAMFEFARERSTATVFVVDGDPLAASSVEGLSRMMNLACERFVSGRDFLAAYDPRRPGCVVLEVHVPDVSGLEIQRQLAERGAPHPLIFLAARARLSIAVQAMRSGAIHFLQKPIREHELWAALDEAIELDARRRKQHEHEEKFRQCMERLTPRDWQLLEKLIEGGSNRAIAAELGISKRTVEQRRAALLRKFNVNSLPQLIRMAMRANGTAVPLFADRLNALVETAR